MIKVEVVACSVEDALAAERAGAHRLEVCARFDQGGITPALDVVNCITEACKLPLVVMLRPRPGDFCYSEAEILECESLLTGLAPEMGIVFGALKPDGTVDEDTCCRVMKLAGKRDMVFHRAFDSVSDPFRALETIIDLGFKRLLTSGGKATALEGAETIKRLIEQADGRIEILPGGGVRAGNVKEVVFETGADQVHLGPFVETSDLGLKLDEIAVSEVVSLVR
jgi:copper homeostasis protein